MEGEMSDPCIMCEESRIAAKSAEGYRDRWKQVADTLLKKGDKRLAGQALAASIEFGRIVSMLPSTMEGNDE
jgi:hypothetical protein